jgi:hypothetical protein
VNSAQVVADVISEVRLVVGERKQLEQAVESRLVAALIEVISTGRPPTAAHTSSRA